MSVVRVLLLLLVAATFTPQVSAAIGPEQRMAIDLPQLHAAIFDGSDFLVAYEAGTAGLHIQRISTAGELVGPPVRITPNRPRKVEVVSRNGSTAVLWSECNQPGSNRCTFRATWLGENGKPGGEPKVVHDAIRDFAAAAAPGGGDSLFVAWDGWTDRPLYVSELRRGASTFGRTEIVADAHRDGAADLFLASNSTAILAGWRQTLVVGPAMPYPSLDWRLKIRPLDSGGRPAGPPLRLEHAQIITSFEAAGDEGFVVAGAAYDRSSRITRLASDGSISAVHFVPGTRFATVTSTGDTLFAPTVRPSARDKQSDAYLTVIRGGATHTYSLRSDPAFEPALPRLAPGGDRVLAVSLTRERATQRQYMAWRIIDDLPFPPLPVPPSAPRLTAMTATMPATAHLQWEPVEGARAYRLRHSISDEPGRIVERAFAPEITTASIALPVPEAEYEFELVVETEAGLTESQPVVVRTPAGGAPRSPLNVSADVAENGIVTLRWTDASTNETGFEVFHGYTIGRMATLAANTTEFTFALPAPGIFAFSVVAVNDAGRSQSGLAVVEIAPPQRRRRAAGR